jgi:hypothetical protein
MPKDESALSREEKAKRLGISPEDLEKIEAIAEAEARAKINAEKKLLPELEQARFEEQRKLIAEHMTAQSLAPYLHTIKAFSQLNYVLPGMVSNFKAIDSDGYIMSANKKLLDSMMGLYERCKNYETRKAMLNPVNTSDYDKGLGELEKLANDMEGAVKNVFSSVEPIMTSGIIEKLVENTEAQKVKFIVGVYEFVLDTLVKAEDILNDDVRRSAYPDFDQKKASLVMGIKDLKKNYFSYINKIKEKTALSGNNGKSNSVMYS